MNEVISIILDNPGLASMCCFLIAVGSAIGILLVEVSNEIKSLQ